MASLTIAVLSLLLHPHVQSRAQAEIDTVIGRERLPDFGDRASAGDRIHSYSPVDRSRPQTSNVSIICEEYERTNEGRNGALKLVYVEAVCRELLRWMVVLPLGIPHAALKNDVYNGMFIEKGALNVFVLTLSKTRQLVPPSIYSLQERLSSGMHGMSLWPVLNTRQPIHGRLIMVGPSCMILTGIHNLRSSDRKDS